MNVFQPFAESVWLCPGDTVNFGGMPYTTRMTVVELGEGRLWVHSPVAPSDTVLSDLRVLGEPAHIVSPNKLHHLHLEQWSEKFPGATLYEPPGLGKKRPDIKFDSALPAAPECGWADAIDQLIFEGSWAMREAVFFHRSSSTLILGDLIENFPESHFTGMKKIIAKMGGIIAPRGKTPLDWRLTFFLGKKSARQSFHKILEWQPENIVLAHGECMRGQGVAKLRESFAWL